MSSGAINVKDEVRVDEDEITQLKFHNKVKSITGTVFVTSSTIVG